MRLSKAQRTELFTARVIELEMPASDNPPYPPGRTYKINNSEMHVRIMRQRRKQDGKWGVVLVPDDVEPVRYPARGLGYTTHAPRALDVAAVPEDYQEKITKEVREKEQQRRTADLAERAAAVGIDVDDLLR